MSIRLFERGKNEMMFWEGSRALSMFVCSYTCPFRSIGWAGDGELMQGAAGVISLIDH